jgi:hypothetical protein
MQRVCVYAGSSTGNRAAYRHAATALGEALVASELGLVYGGGGVGLMGIVADAVLAGGGEVIGVIPDFLARKELLHARVSDMRVVSSMHERKALMAELADAFIALPGGMGTLEELCETLTWAQLGLHGKPCGLLDVDRYWAGLVAQLEHCVGEGFLRREHRAMLVVEGEPAALLERFAAYRAPVLPKWLDLEQT